MDERDEAVKQNAPSNVEPGFGGRIGRTVAESQPFWPGGPPSRHRPNVVVIVLDDVGFAQLGCYGSSIATPHMDALAAGGVRYSNFHVAALCSPTRASLLTGRNHHSVGMGFLAAFDTGFPSYRATVTPRAATIAEVLGDQGFGTYAVGKWHLTPPREMSPAGPFGSWPTRRGFDRYYGFLWGEDDQYAPELWHDQHRVDPPRQADYHLSEDLVERAREFVSDHLTARPDDPFFLYLGFGACHAPHQAPRDFIDAYRGAFDHGWDVERERVLARQVESGLIPAGTSLAPRNPGVAAWESLSADQRALYARMQEVFAGFMTHTDAQIGRLVDFLSAQRLLEDTVIVLMSDNGASGEGGEHGSANEYRWFLRLPDPLEDSLAAIDELGGPHAHNHYPTGWAQAGNTPGKFYKRQVYAGGVRAPLIVHWPNGLSGAGSVRTQFHHVIDIAPTLLEICGASMPDVYRGVEQMPVHGVSMAYTFAEPEADSRRTVQYFETAGYRGIYCDGYKAVAAHEPGADFDADRWELFRLDDDFSECHDLSAREPELADRLRRLWWTEAEKYDVLPLDDRMQTRMAAQNPARDRLRYRMLPGTRLLNGVVGPSFSGRRFQISARVERRRREDDGVLLAWGRRPAGFSLFILGGRLMFDYNLAGEHTLVSTDRMLPLGPATVGMRMDVQGDAVMVRMLLDREVIGERRVPCLVPGGMGTLSIQCGHNSPSAVSQLYQPPFTFTGTLHHVVIDLEPRDRDPSEGDWAAEMATQ